MNPNNSSYLHEKFVGDMQSQEISEGIGLFGNTHIWKNNLGIQDTNIR